MDPPAKRQKIHPYGHPDNKSAYQSSWASDEATIMEDQQPKKQAMGHLPTNTADMVQQHQSEDGNGQCLFNAERVTSPSETRREVTEVNPQQLRDPVSNKTMSCCTVCGGPFEIQERLLGVLTPASLAENPHLIPWFCRKVYLAVSILNFQQNSAFTPRRASHIELLQKDHEDFDRHEDFCRLNAGFRTTHELASSAAPHLTPATDSAQTAKLPSNPDRPEFMGRNLKRDRSASATPDVDIKVKDASKSQIDVENQVPGKLEKEDFVAFPLHKACCAIASNYIRAVNRHSDKLMTLKGVSSWVHLYQHLQARCKNRSQTGYRVADSYPHGFRGHDWVYSGYSKVFEASPTNTSCTTAYILSKLRPLPHNVILVNHKRTPTMRLQSCPRKLSWLSIPVHHGSIQALLLRDTTLDLPDHIITFVREELNGLHNPSLKSSQSSYLPEYWREILLRGFPWLWDLDHKQCRLKDSETYEDGSKIRWDWEKLVRQLAQDDVFESEGGLGGAPAGLRNRRRIWRCLDEMRMPVDKEDGGECGMGDPNAVMPPGRMVGDMDEIVPLDS